jgi:hypothetical protein
MWVHFHRSYVFFSCLSWELKLAKKLFSLSFHVMFVQVYINRTEDIWTLPLQIHSWTQAVMSKRLYICRKETMNSIRGCIQKIPDWPPGVRTSCSCIAILWVSPVSFCCFSMSVYCCKRTFRYRLSPETFGYTVVYCIYCHLTSMKHLTIYVDL